MGLAKARIYSVDASDKAKLIITVQFNPESYSLTRTVNYRGKGAIQKGTYDVTQFVNCNDYTFNVELLFDTSTDPKKEDVRRKIKPLLQCVYLKNEKNSEGKVINLIEPKKFRFAWGTFCFTGFIESLNENYTMFHSNGMPARARVTISATGQVGEIKYDASSEVEEKNMTSHLMSQSKVGNPRKNSL
ncbi:CIS tube protein [Cellulosilyticum ruminicola]|uniref:CIS tube protein n=1 Tax=Cellulosilyticum ruminicola TaxID=425254 RepID=UPI0006D29464|nr:hypothetical protein [Cellulosilyticum ruminicola]